ncbi:hypothetical protein ACS0TY_033248 [Phlomoides rotata]
MHPQPERCPMPPCSILLPSCDLLSPRRAPPRVPPRPSPSHRDPAQVVGELRLQWVILDMVGEQVREKRGELDKLRNNFVKKASEFLRNYFTSLVDFMISDKSYFSQRGQLKRPDHADLRYKCRTYARLLQHLKSLDKNCLGPLRKAYCSSLNLLLRREAREFANELRASTKASRNLTVWLDGSTGSNQSASSADTSTVSEAYAKMLNIFIPLLVDEVVMCFQIFYFLLLLLLSS